MEGEIINKVAQAGIVQLDLADFKLREPMLGIDLKAQLWQELVLREKDFRDWVKQHDWTAYTDKYVHVYCSADAIIPAWAYMLVSSQLKHAAGVAFGDAAAAHEEFFFQNLQNWDIHHLEGQRVMVKGCSDIPAAEKAYVVLTTKLVPVVKSLMFGEPCSAVPVYKK